jgi:[ribosomal protein S5]-alanine N-acetyltransferase
METTKSSGHAFDWHFGLPTLRGTTLTLREVRPGDAPSLLLMLGSEEVAEFVSPLPTTVDGFSGFISEALSERAMGRSFCFAVVPYGYEDAMGVFQVRGLDPAFQSAEWGFGLGSPFWGSGIFVEAANLVIDFAFKAVGVNRLEARSITANRRGNAALSKLGALQEGVLRRSFQRDGRYFDQILWSILRDEWNARDQFFKQKFH